MSTAIEFVNVGKQYRLGLVGTGTLQHDLNRWWQTAILRKEDPYLKIGEVNDRSTKGNSDYVWALKDINFKVEQGDVVGIIGKNGAGKSTLLKLLSHITAPTTGHITYRGRIASLLEVGTGFHPEMTARQNIYMNGSIMGMTKQEITRKLDEIVDFAGIERYLDTPVKRFSSGMTVRLGFAVAAFLEPEILVVDEVLAVGDAEFQKKAIGKMQDVAKGDGRTVLFVSHNMAAVKSLCKHGIVLNNGMLCFRGTADDAINEYIASTKNNVNQRIIENITMINKAIDVDLITINGSEDSEQTIPTELEFIEIRLRGKTKIDFSADVMFIMFSMDDTPMATFAEGLYNGYLDHFRIGNFDVMKRIRVPKRIYGGKYKIGIYFMMPDVCFYLRVDNAAILDVEGRKDKFGRALLMKDSGFMGLESY